MKVDENGITWVDRLDMARMVRPYLKRRGLTLRQYLEQGARESNECCACHAFASEPEVDWDLHYHWTAWGDTLADWLTPGWRVDR